MRTWIKICGTTCVEDALESVEAGADALGFIFARSKREIGPQQAQKIIRELPPQVERIGVFLNARPETIATIVNEVDLTGIQMHGEDDVPRDVYGHLPAGRRDGLRKIKTILVRERFELRFDASAAAPPAVDTWLFDSGAGSGTTFDWQDARARLGGRTGQFVLAGGLTAENVSVAIRAFHPWGVDVVTGVEREAGRKDPKKLEQFIAAVRRAEK